MRPFEAIRAEIQASNAKLDTMIDAHHQLITALTTLAQQMAHPPLLVSATGHQAADMMREVSRNWAEQRAATLQQQTTLAPPYTGVRSSVSGRRVPRGTPAVPGEVIAELAGAIMGNSQDEGALADELDTIGIEVSVGYTPEVLSEMANELLDELAEAEDDQDLLPEPDEDGLWQKRLTMHALRLWQPDWGPRPGQEGCRVPQHLMHNGSAR